MTRRSKIILGIPAFLVLLLIILYLVIFQFGLLEYVVNRQLNNIIGEKFPLTVHIGRVSGNYYSTLIIRDIVVTYSDSTISYDLARVPELMAEYSISDIWRGRLNFSGIFIDSAVFSLHKDENGKWLVPRPRGKSTGKKISAEFKIDEFGLNNLQFQIVSPTDTTTFDDILLVAHIEGREDTYSIDIDALSYWSSDSRLSLKSGGGKATLTGNSLMFQDIFVITDSSDILLGGQLFLEKVPRMRINLKARKLNVREVFALLGINLNGNLAADGYVEFEEGDLSGDVLLSGAFMGKSLDSLNTRFDFSDNFLRLDTLSGTVFNGCKIEATGAVNLKPRPEEYQLAGRIRNFDLNNLLENSFTSNLSGDLVMSGEGFKKENMAMNFAVDLDESWFDIYHAHKAIGKMTVTSDSLIFYDNFEIRYDDNRFFAQGRMVYSGDIDISGRAEFNDLSDFNNMIFIKEMGGRGNFVGGLSGELKNPDLSGIFLSDSLWLYQVYSSGARCGFDIKHFIYDRYGQASLNLFGGNAYDVPLDSSKIDMDIDSLFVHITNAEYYNSFASVHCLGVLDYVSYPQKLLIDEVDIRLFDLPFENDNPVEIFIDSAGYEFAKLKLQRPTGYIGWKGRVNYDETLDLDISCRGINTAAWITLLSDEYEIAGKLSGEAHLTGAFNSPLINYTGRIDSLSYEDLVLGDLYANFNYADKNIYTDSLTLNSYGGFYQAQGNYPIDLSLVKVDDRFPENEQNIKITARDTRFDLLSLMIEEVENMVGDFKAELVMTGTPSKPKLDGHATVTNGRLKLYDLVYPLEKLNLKLKMIDQTIYFDSVSAICHDGTTGSIGADGKIVINSIDQFDYDINIGIKNFPAKYELGDITSLVNANLNVVGLTPPTVYGDVTIIDAEYRENFAEENEGWIILESLEGEKTWNLNLNAEFPSNFWIKNDDIDAEFSGTLNFIREQGVYRYIGSMEVLRGKGFLAGRTFRIEPGGTISYEDIEYPNPRLDITATTKIRRIVSTTFESEPTTETIDQPVHIGGTLDEPIIEAAEGSLLSTEELIPALATNVVQDENGIDRQNSWFQDRLISGVTDYISTQFSQIGSRTLSTIGVETFEIDPVYGDKFDPLGTRLGVGFYMSPNLYVYGRSSISGAAGQQVGFEYRLQRFMLLEGRADQNDLYQLILNFYWEY